MTCIVAVKDALTRTVVMGGDSRRNMNGGLTVQLPVDAAKVFEFSGFVVGHTGMSRIRNLTSRLRLRFGAQGPQPEFNLEDTLLEVVIPGLKDIAKRSGLLQEKDGISTLGGQIIIAFGDQICVILDDFSVTPISGNFWAIGSGERLALGSLATTEGLVFPETLMSAEDRVLKALQVASAFDSSVAPPFVIKRTVPIPLTSA